MPRIPAAERPRLTLEDYIVFFTTRGGTGLRLHQLNEIIYMHAFARLHRQPKPEMVDALRSVDLMRPRRSTVPLNAAAPSPSAAPAAAAALSVDEAMRDMEDLGWRECPVGSLLSVRAGMRSLDADADADAAAAAAATPVPISVIVPGSTERISPPSVLSSAAAAATPVPISVIAPGSTERISPPSLISSAIAPGSTERISPPSLLSASSPPPPVPPTAARRKRSLTGMGKAATKVRRRRVVELLTLPSVEMATSA